MPTIQTTGFKRAVLLLAGLALCGCNPKQQATNPQVSKPAQQVKSGAYPREALKYLEDSLKHPTEGYPALAYTWTVISQLDQLPGTLSAAAIRNKVNEQAVDSKDNPPPELVAAWLNCNTANARAFVQHSGSNGSWRYVGSLTFQPRIAREMFTDPAKRVIPPSAITSELAQQWLGLQSNWNLVEPQDEPMLKPISDRPGEPGNSLRAAGWLLRLNPDNQRMVDYLKFAVRRATEKREVNVMMGAVEGIKISRMAEFADVLVPVVANIKIGAPDPPTDPKAKPTEQEKKDQPSANQLYGAYALTYIDGEQASLMRRKLLGASNAQVRWQARLGELLHGDPKPWDAGVAKEGVTVPELWIALEPLDRAAPGLIPTYGKLVESSDASLRLRASTQLARFGGLESNADVVQLVTTLMGDKVAEVRAGAWYAAGRLGIGSPLPVLPNKKETPEVRLAAAYCALMQAQGGPPDVKMQVKHAADAAPVQHPETQSDESPAAERNKPAESGK